MGDLLKVEKFVHLYPLISLRENILPCQFGRIVIYRRVPINSTTLSHPEIISHHRRSGWYRRNPIGTFGKGIAIPPKDNVGQIRLFDFFLVYNWM